MSASNGVIRVGRKGKKKFAFGEDGTPFEVDVVVAFQEWIAVDDSFREQFENRTIPTGAMRDYHAAALEFVSRLACNNQEVEMPEITTAEALDFLARLREQYDEIADFFHPKSRDERASQGTSAVGLRFSEEPAAN